MFRNREGRIGSRMLANACWMAACCGMPPSVVASELYDITLIAIQRDRFDGEWGPTVGRDKAINDAGLAAYVAERYVNVGGTFQFQYGIFAGDGHSNSLLAEGSSWLVGLNNSGAVAYNKSRDGRAVTLYTDGGIERDLLADCLDFQTCPRVGGLGLSNNTRVAALVGANPGKIAIVEPVSQLTAQTTFLSNAYLVEPSVSRNGLYAAAGGDLPSSAGSAVWLLDPRLVGSIGEFQVCSVLAACKIDAAWHVSVNNWGNVAFVATDYRSPSNQLWTSLVGVASPYESSLGLQRVFEVDAVRVVNSPSINNLNEVMFTPENPQVGEAAVLVGDVSGRTPSPVIYPLEPFSSPTKNYVFANVAQYGTHPHSLNDRGQLVFTGYIREAGSSNNMVAVLRADPKPGVSPGNPILPGPGDLLPGGGWKFGACNSWSFQSNPSRTPCYVDPPVAVGYEFTVTAGQGRFETVHIPAPLPNGDREFQVEFEGTAANLRAGQRYAFTDMVSAGVSRFRITGIDTAEALDPDDERAFVTGLTFAGEWSEDFEFTMVPIVDGSNGATLSLKQSVVAGCKSVVGTVTLPEAAPIGGTVVTLGDTLANAITPLSVKVAAGATSAKFTIKTSPTSLSEAGQVTATLNGSTVSQPLTVRPMGLLSVALSPTTTVGSQPVVGTVKLECKAGPGPITVDLQSSQPALANPVAGSIVVPQGLQSATFDISTNPVLAKSTATISGTANGITKGKTLTVTPAASASPTSLKFGSVTIGATSAPQAVTLTNKGTLPFSVTSVALVGTSASWFLLQNNCPANLPAGGSCTIDIQFKPIAAGSKSAKLSIATSATSTPLSVSLSGTGL